MCGREWSIGEPVHQSLRLALTVSLAPLLLTVVLAVLTILHLPPGGLGVMEYVYMWE